MQSCNTVTMVYVLISSEFIGGSIIWRLCIIALCCQKHYSDTTPCDIASRCRYEQGLRDFSNLWLHWDVHQAELCYGLNNGWLSCELGRYR